MSQWVSVLISRGSSDTAARTELPALSEVGHVKREVRLE